MADITLGTEYTPYPSQLKNNGVLAVRFSGAGADATDIETAAGAGTRIVIVGGYVSAPSACSYTFKSGSNVIYVAELAAPGTMLISPGLGGRSCDANADLTLTNDDEVEGFGEVLWVVLEDGDSCPLVCR